MSDSNSVRFVEESRNGTICSDHLLGFDQHIPTRTHARVMRRLIHTLVIIEMLLRVRDQINDMLECMESRSMRTYRNYQEQHVGDISAKRIAET